MRFQATEQQIKQIAVRAIKASRPLGLGILNHSPELNLDPEDIKLTERGLRLDYVAGRCVKLFIDRQENNWWYIEDSVDPQYQTWMYTYRSNEALIECLL